MIIIGKKENIDIKNLSNVKLLTLCKDVFANFLETKSQYLCFRYKDKK